MSAPEIKTYLEKQVLDSDPTETVEWVEAFLDLLSTDDPSRPLFILNTLIDLANKHQINWVPELVTPYVNTIPVDQQPSFPGD